MATENIWQPDLFLVMSEEELKGALDIAKETASQNGIAGGGISAKTFENIAFNVYNPNIYSLSMNGEDVGKYIFDDEGRHTAIFPVFNFYILIQVSKVDYIALATSPTLWPDSKDIHLIEKIIAEKGIDVISHVGIKKSEPGKLLSEAEEFYKMEAAIAKRIPTVSPWTIRDTETLKSALTPGEESAISSVDDISSIVLVSNSNIELQFNAVYPYIGPGRYVYYPIQKELCTFSFPNSLIIYTKDNKKTVVYVGPEVSLEDIREILRKTDLNELATEEDFRSVDTRKIVNELLLPPRSLKKEEKMM